MLSCASLRQFCALTRSHIVIGLHSTRQSARAADSEDALCVLVCYSVMRKCLRLTLCVRIVLFLQALQKDIHNQ